MRLVAVGRMKDKAELALVDRYRKRLRPALDIVELPDGRGSAEEIKRREAQAILAACPANSFVLALDEGGQSWGSPALASAMQGWMTDGRQPVLLLAVRKGWMLRATPGRCHAFARGSYLAAYACAHHAGGTDLPGTGHSGWPPLPSFRQALIYSVSKNDSATSCFSHALQALRRTCTSRVTSGMFCPARMATANVARGAGALMA